MTHRILLTAYIFLTTYIHEIQSLFSKLYYIIDSGVLKELSGVLQAIENRCRLYARQKRYLPRGRGRSLPRQGPVSQQASGGGL